MRHWKKFSTAVTIVALGLAVRAGAAVAVNQRAPGFALPDIHFNYHDLADYRGKVVLLEIMQTRCPECQKLSQMLEKLKANFGDQVAVIGIVNPPDNQQTVAAFIDQFKISSPVLFDCGQAAASYLRPDPRRPQIHLPHLFLIDQNGIVRAHYDPVLVRDLQAESLVKKVRQLLDR